MQGRAEIPEPPVQLIGEPVNYEIHSGLCAGTCIRPTLVNQLDCAGETNARLNFSEAGIDFFLLLYAIIHGNSPWKSRGYV
jgi:hypothetical protein